jgi:chromate reductase, NAD(P)H dehydrogenase (quinone)
MNSVEAYIQFEPGLIKDDGVVTKESTEKFLRKYLDEYAAFLSRACTVPPGRG